MQTNLRASKAGTASQRRHLPAAGRGSHVAAGQVWGRDVIRLETADSDLRVPAAVHGPLVDVGAAYDDVLRARHVRVTLTGLINRGR